MIFSLGVSADNAMPRALSDPLGIVHYTAFLESRGGFAWWPFCNFFLKRQVYWYTSWHFVIQICNICLRVASYRKIRVVLRIVRSAKKIRPDPSVRRGNKYFFDSSTDDPDSLSGLCTNLTTFGVLPFHPQLPWSCACGPSNKP